MKTTEKFLNWLHTKWVIDGYGFKLSRFVSEYLTQCWDLPVDIPGLPTDLGALRTIHPLMRRAYAITAATSGWKYKPNQHVIRLGLHTHLVNDNPMSNVLRAARILEQAFPEYRTFIVAATRLYGGAPALFVVQLPEDGREAWITAAKRGTDWSAAYIAPQISLRQDVTPKNVVKYALAVYYSAPLDRFAIYDTQLKPTTF